MVDVVSHACVTIAVVVFSIAVVVFSLPSSALLASSGSAIIPMNPINVDDTV